MGRFGVAIIGILLRFSVSLLAANGEEGEGGGGGFPLAPLAFQLVAWILSWLWLLTLKVTLEEVVGHCTTQRKTASKPFALPRCVSQRE